jgi:hypothetical protein
MSVVASAQLYTCTVTGVVSDPSGAVIPDAKVELVDQAKGYSFTAKTDATGRFLFNSASPLIAHRREPTRSLLRRRVSKPQPKAPSSSM